MRRRRDFLKTVAMAPAARVAAAPPRTADRAAAPRPEAVGCPRSFTGRRLKTIAFPPGGVAAASISLGGRGQLRDWEIFNRAIKGAAPQYAFAASWARGGESKAVARVLVHRHTVRQRIAARGAGADVRVPANSSGPGGPAAGAEL